MSARPGLVLSDDERLLAETAQSFARARFQIKVQVTTDVAYLVFPGNILDSPPPPPPF